MLLGKLFTRPLQDHDAGGEIGQFEIDVIVDHDLFMKSGDKAGLVKRQFSAHLASCIHDTQVPIEYWQGLVEEKVARHCSRPTVLNFGAAKK